MTAERRCATLAPAEVATARRVVFAWGLLPAASRLVHDVMAGRDAEEAVADIRAAAGLLDRIGWPGDALAPAGLDAHQADFVRAAALAHVTRGFHPAGESGAPHGPAHAAHTPRGSVGRLLLRLEQGGDAVMAEDLMTIRDDPEDPDHAGRERDSAQATSSTTGMRYFRRRRHPAIDAPRSTSASPRRTPPD